MMVTLQEETQKDAEMINKSLELMAKLGHSFSTFMSAVLEKFGQELSGIFKDFLECAICKELSIEVTIFNI